MWVWTLLILVLFSCIVAFVRATPYEHGPWRTSLDGEGACWTDRSCQRVMTCAHGGEWSVKYPYDSLPAFERAVADGADAIKGDFRVAKDNVGVVMHSSPVEVYESLACRGKYVEEMTSEECSQCQMEFTTYKFLTVPQLLSWAENKINVMFCVKESRDIPRAISTLIEENATHRAFLEVHVQELLDQEAMDTPGWDQVYYVVEMSNRKDLDSMLAASEAVQARAFLLEFNSLDGWSDAEDDIALAKSAGFRTFTKSNGNQISATVGNHLNLFKMGVDVAYTYNLTNAVTARKIVNSYNSILPP